MPPKTATHLNSDASPFFWPLTLTAALLVRVYYFSMQGGMHFPDEIFQYLEPAHWRITGSAWLPWEYDRGLRNWILPGFYGAWMELLRALGLRAIALQRTLWVVTLGLSLFVLPAVYRLGKLLGGDVQTARLATVLVALFPVTAWLSPHTLSENFGVIFSTWGVYCWIAATKAGAETAHEPTPAERRALALAVLSGALLGLGCGFRFTLVILLPLVVLDFNFRSQFVAMGAFLFGLFAALAVIGLVDRLTWGGFLHSFIEFIDYNVIEKGNEDHGVMVWHFYLSTALWKRLGIGLLVAIPLLIAGLRTTWRLVLQCVIFVLAHTLIGHKEERFLLSMWPLFLVAVSVGASTLLERYGQRRAQTRRKPMTALTLVCGLLLVPTFVGVGSARMDWQRDLFRAQQWVGEQPDATGLLYEARIHLNGGYTIFDANVPQTPWSPALAGHALFNYVASQSPRVASTVRARGFVPVAQFGEIEVFRRAP